MISNVSSGGYSPMMQGMHNRMPPNPEQMAEDLLSSADTDSNGAISKKEFTALFSSEETSDSSDINGLFSDLDADGDEAVSLDEATNAVSNLLQQLQEQRMSSDMPPPPPPPPQSSELAEELMSYADTDQDGSLTMDEFSAALQSSENGDEETLARIFDETDTDGDGIVTQEELLSAMESKQSTNAQSSVNSSTAEDNASMVANSLLQQYQQNAMNVASNASVSITA